MRHLRSVIYSLVLAPAVWILCGVGFDQDLTGRARDNGGIESVSGVLLLLLAGAAYLILLSPISPLGPLIAGLVFLGVGAWARLAPDSYAGMWPSTVASDGFNLSTPGYGLAVLLAVPLLGTALSARRWRGYEPPEILLIGTLGRARGAAPVAGTTMAAERTTVIPQQRQAPGFVPGFGAASGDATQVVPPFRPAQEADDGDEKTTVLRLGTNPVPHREESTQVVTPAGEENRTEDLAADRPTEAIREPGDATQVVRSPGEPTGAVRSPGETTEAVRGPGEATGEETTRLVLPGGGDEPVTVPVPLRGADGDERTQPIRFSEADGNRPAEAGETPGVRTGTVDPPGDRTQLLAFPGEAATVAGPVVAEEDPTRGMSIMAAERPDPGEDPTTRLGQPDRHPGEATTRAVPNPRPATVSSLERPADEAADDTRPLRTPAQRPPADQDVTRRL